MGSCDRHSRLDARIVRLFCSRDRSFSFVGASQRRHNNKRRLPVGVMGGAGSLRVMSRADLAWIVVARARREIAALGRTNTLDWHRDAQQGRARRALHRRPSGCCLEYLRTDHDCLFHDGSSHRRVRGVGGQRRLGVTYHDDGQPPGAVQGFARVLLPRRGLLEPPTAAAHFNCVSRSFWFFYMKYDI